MDCKILQRLNLACYAIRLAACKGWTPPFPIICRPTASTNWRRKGGDSQRSSGNHGGQQRHCIVAILRKHLGNIFERLFFCHNYELSGFDLKLAGNCSFATSAISSCLNGRRCRCTLCRYNGAYVIDLSLDPGRYPSFSPLVQDFYQQTDPLKQSASG